MSVGGLLGLHVSLTATQLGDARITIAFIGLGAGTLCTTSRLLLEVAVYRRP